LSFISSTQSIPETQIVPQHVAIIMDGNGRWATNRHLPRTAGHVKGVQSVRKVVQTAATHGVKYLTLFAFSSENWRRPEEEVTLLMRLFMQALEREVAQLKKQGVRLRVIGDRSKFDTKLQSMMSKAEASTAENDAFHLTIAANYGGRWDILNATRRMLVQNPNFCQQPEHINEAELAPYLSMAWAPEPDLFIRTGGEQRVSNFLIWQLAYTELFFTEKYWPDFGEAELLESFVWYRTRERRFGRTSAQLTENQTTA
jgi:undecaprenyl diphosphate synthase